ncbi:MAG: MFS transporter [Dehalococcoidia bacterium]
MAQIREAPAAPPSDVVQTTGRRLRLPRTFAALRNRDYRLLWLGTLGSFTAMQMQQVARGYLAYDLSGSAAVLGVVGLSFGLPQLIFSLFGGVIADRVKKRNLLLVTQICTGLVALATAVLVATDIITIWQLIVLGVLQGTIFSFNMPARQAFLADLVGPPEMMNAIALNNAGMNVTRIFGPALAGFLISVPFVGLSNVFYFMAACYLLPVLTLFQIRPRYAGGGRPKAPMVQEFVGGLKYIAGHELLGMLLLLGLMPIILGFPYQMLLPVFASSEVHNVGARGLGLMSAFTGVGALIGALVVATATGVRRRGRLQLFAGAGFGVSLLIFGLAPTFPLALLALAAVGFTGSVYQSLNSTLIMTSTEPAYYGRVMSVNMMGFSLMPIAALPIGVIADRLGAPQTIALCGLAVTLFIVGVATFVRSYRRIEVEVPAQPHGGRPMPSGS